MTEYENGRILDFGENVYVVDGRLMCIRALTGRACNILLKYQVFLDFRKYVLYNGMRTGSSGTHIQLHGGNLSWQAF